MERPGWSEMYWIFWGQEVLLLILWHSSISVWRIILIISGLFFRKSLRYHHLYSWYMENILRCGVLIFLYDKVNYDNVSTVSHKPFQLKRILIYSKRFFLWQSDYWRTNLFLILSPISPFHCWSSIITEMLLTFPSFSNDVSAFLYKRKTKEIRSIINGIFFSVCIME
jgi:hypothetical protein